MGNKTSRVPVHKEPNFTVTLQLEIKMRLSGYVRKAENTIRLLKSKMNISLDEYDLTVKLIKQLRMKLHHLEATVQEQSVIIPRNQILVMLQQLNKCWQELIIAHCQHRDASEEAEARLEQQIGECQARTLWDGYTMSNIQYLLNLTEEMVAKFQLELGWLVDRVFYRQMKYIEIARTVKVLVNNQNELFQEFESERKKIVPVVNVAPKTIQNKPVETGVNEADRFKRYNPTLTEVSNGIALSKKEVPYIRESNNENVSSKNEVPFIRESNNENVSSKNEVPYIRDSNNENVSSLSRLLLEKPDLLKPIHRAFFKGRFRHNVIATHISDGPISGELFERRSVFQSDLGLLVNEFQSKVCLSSIKQQTSVSVDAEKVNKVLKLNDVDSTALEAFEGIDIRDNKTYCKICKTYIPSWIYDIKLHVNGRSHKKNQNVILTVSMNSVVKDGKIVKSDRHKKKLQLTEQVTLAVKTPVALPVGDLTAITPTSPTVGDGKPKFCTICNISYPGGVQNMTLHVNGIKHQKKLANSKPVNVSVPVLPLKKKKVGTTDKNYVLSTSKESVQHSVTKNSTDGFNILDVVRKFPEMKVINDETVCIVCNVKIPGGSTYIESHVEGKMHKDNMPTYNRKATVQGQNGSLNTSKIFVNEGNAELCKICTTKLSNGACVNCKINIRPNQSKVLSKPNNVSVVQANNVPIVSTSVVSETSLHSTVFCKVCKINHPGGPDNITIHVMSNTHQKALIEDARKLKAIKEPSNTNIFFCKLCNTSIYGRANYMQHNNGMRHMSAVKKSLKNSSINNK